MNGLQNPGSDLFHKLTRSGIQTTGHVAAISLAALLILTWLLTGPIFYASDWITRKRDSKTKKGKL